MDQIREIELEGGGYVEVSASASGHLTEPVRVRMHSPKPGPLGAFITPAEAVELAVSLIMAADRAEGRELADPSGPVAIIEALRIELYHPPGSGPSLLHQHTAAAIDAILGAR